MRIGNLTFDPIQRRLGSASLTPKAARLLELLAEAAPEPLSHEALYEKLWPGTFVEPGNLHNLVAEIRGAADASMLRTIHRFGYALAWPVQVRRYALLIGDERIDLGEGETILGREQLGSADVSRRHARIVIGDAVTIEDLGSKNGTFVGTRRADQPVALSDGDEVFFGRTKATFIATSHSDTTLTVESRE